MLKERSWFTENTEVLTTNGWINIGLLHKIEEVIVIKNSILGKDTIKEYNKAFYRGVIKKYKNHDLICTAKNLIVDSIWRVDKVLPLPDPVEMEYKGYIFNIITPSNTLITRSIIDGTDNEDYLLSKCKIEDSI